MKRTLRPLAVLAMVALISMFSAGCGSNAPSDNGAATSSGTPATGSDTGSSSDTVGNKKLAARDKAVKFAGCMRNDGLSDFRTPTRTASSSMGSVARGVREGRRGVQGLAATRQSEREAELQGGDGEPQVRPVHARKRREGLFGPGQW